MSWERMTDEVEKLVQILYGQRKRMRQNGSVKKRWHTFAAGDYKHANTRTHRTNDREGSEWDIFIGRGHWRDRKSQPESRGYSLSLFLCVCVGIYTPYRRDYSASVSLSPSVLNRLVFLFSFVFFFFLLVIFGDLHRLENERNKKNNNTIALCVLDIKKISVRSIR